MWYESRPVVMKSPGIREASERKVFPSEPAHSSRYRNSFSRKSRFILSPVFTMGPLKPLRALELPALEQKLIDVFLTKIIFLAPGIGSFPPGSPEYIAATKLHEDIDSQFGI